MPIGACSVCRGLLDALWGSVAEASKGSKHRTMFPCSIRARYAGIVNDENPTSVTGSPTRSV